MLLGKTIITDFTDIDNRVFSVRQFHRDNSVFVFQPCDLHQENAPNFKAMLEKTPNATTMRTRQTFRSARTLPSWRIAANQLPAHPNHEYAKMVKPVAREFAFVAYEQIRVSPAMRHFLIPSYGFEMVGGFGDG